MNGLKGIHHVTAITSSAEKNYEFFTYVLGMRLVKKTVNQDDIQTYHLFFADDKGSAGTDMTFFDFPGIPKGRHGTDEIYKTSFRVPNDAALDYWVKRFDRMDVKHQGIQELFGKKHSLLLISTISNINSSPTRTMKAWLRERLGRRGRFPWSMRLQDLARSLCGCPISIISKK